MSCTGETDLSKLLSDLKPELRPGSYVFAQAANTDELALSEVIGTFKEREGLTLILEKKRADQLKLKYDFVVAWITLSVHSSLEAVGLTAAVSNALAKANISCNVVAAYFHDHIFVAESDAEMALRILDNLNNTNNDI